MFKRHLPTALAGLLFAFFFALSCTKLDTTKLGNDLIPEVDNINTFAETLRVETVQGSFLPNDTTKVLYSDAHVLGHLENDAMFGKTDAAIYFQLKPLYYPFYFGNAGDTTRNTGIPGAPTLPSNIVGVDSVYLCLAYVSAYGDSSLPIQLEVREIIDDTFRLSPGKTSNVTYQPRAVGPVLGSATVDITSLKNQVKFAHDKDSSTNQIRIKLTDPDFITMLYNGDTTASGIYRNDSLFRNRFNGLVVQPVGNSGNALMYISLTDANTRLEIHYRKRRAVVDTVYTSFSLYATSTAYGAPSSTANSVKRTIAGYPAATPGSEFLYMLSNPGTFANFSVPALSTWPNRIIHKATLLMESVPDNPITDSIYGPPNYLYLDLKDTASGTGADKWKPIYYDLNPASPYDPDRKTAGYPYYPLSNTDVSSFGGILRIVKNSAGQSVAHYNINVTRYVQQVITKQTPNYSMRVWPAYNFVYPQYAQDVLPYYNLLAGGRVRLASGSYTADTTKRVRLAIIYSKLP